MNKPYEVTQADLPLSCPLAHATLWNAHPKIFLSIEKTGQARCAYCGTEYILKDDQGENTSSSIYSDLS